MKKLLNLVLLFSMLMINAQKNWTVNSADSLVKSENYVGFDEGRDSAIVKTPQAVLRFSRYFPLYDTQIITEIDESLLVRSIKKIKEHTYLLIGISGNENYETQLSLIFIDEREILKYVVIKSIDKRLRDIEYIYDDETKELIFPRNIDNINDPIPIYNIDIKTNKLTEIMPEEDCLTKYQSKFSRRFIGRENTVYYKIKL